MLPCLLLFMLSVLFAACLSPEYFYTKVQHLNWMLESVAADLRQPNHSDTDSQAAVDKAHQLLPIQKFLTALKNDVKETADAIKAVSGLGFLLCKFEAAGFFAVQV
jgi:hypothetical protein